MRLNGRGQPKARAQVERPQVNKICIKGLKLPPEVSSMGWVGPSTTLAWPGRKQPDIPVVMDMARLETSRTDTVKELPGYSVQNCPSGNLLF
jgi:hypothetical protein